MRTRSTRGILLGSLVALAACDQAASTTQPASSHVARTASLTQAALGAVTSDRQLLRSVVLDAVRDGSRNADAWFGDKQHRNRESVCRGLERLFTKHMTRLDGARHRTRSADDRVLAAKHAVSSMGCGKPAPMMLFGRPMAAEAPAIALPDSVDDWMQQNWHPDYWAAKVTDHAIAGGGPIDSYTAGMTDYEISTFAAVQCEQGELSEDLTVVWMDAHPGEDPMMMFFMPKWLKAALIGCATNVVVNIPDIVGAGVAGFGLGGPWGAAGGAAAAAAENCLWGGVAGYLASEMM